MRGNQYWLLSESLVVLGERYNWHGNRTHSPKEIPFQPLVSLRSEGGICPREGGFALGKKVKELALN